MGWGWGWRGRGARSCCVQNHGLHKHRWPLRDAVESGGRKKSAPPGLYLSSSDSLRRRPTLSEQQGHSLLSSAPRPAVQTHPPLSTAAKEPVPSLSPAAEPSLRARGLRSAARRFLRLRASVWQLSSSRAALSSVGEREREKEREGRRKGEREGVRERKKSWPLEKERNTLVLARTAASRQNPFCSKASP